MRKGFANSTSSRWNADTSELISPWPSKFSKGKLTLTRLPPRTGLRGHTYRLLPGPSRLRLRSGAFSVVIVKSWKRLPAHLVLSPSVSIVKNQLDRHWSKIFPAAPVLLMSPFIDNFLNTVTLDYSCFPLTPNPRPAYVVIIGPRGYSYH